MQNPEIPTTRTRRRVQPATGLPLLLHAPGTRDIPGTRDDDHVPRTFMMSLIKRSNLLRWLTRSGSSPPPANGTKPAGAKPRAAKPPRAVGSAGRPGVDLFPRLYPSQLEPRIVLNAAPMAQLDPSGVLEVDAGNFANDGNADTFEVHLSEEGSTLNVSVNGCVVYTGELNSVQGVRISGSGDTDLLALDAAVLDHVEVSFEPGSAAENRDTVQLTAVFGNTWQAVSVDLNSAGGEIQLTRNDGVLSAGLSFTGTVDVIDSLAVADRTLATGGLTSVIITGQGGVLEVQSDVGTLQFTQGDQANWNIDSPAGTLRFEGDLEVLSLNARGDQITVAGNVTASAGAMSFEANNHFQLDETASLITSANSITIAAEDITLAGAIEARDGGAVFATAAEEGTLSVSGLIDASDTRLHGTGGQVHLDGGEVILTGPAEIDVSGTSGGGEIHVGGLKTTLNEVDSEARLIADAIDSGDGGTIILLSEDTTLLAGTLSARGGASSGNGGSVEIFSKQRARSEGQIDVSAVHPQASGGDIKLRADQIELGGEFATSGSGAITLQGDVRLIGDSSLSVEDGNLKVAGTVDGTYALTLAAKTGEITLHGDVGSTEALASLLVQSAGTVSFATTVITTGDQQITAETVLAAALHQTDNAKLTISGDLVLQTNTVLSSGGGDLTLGSIVGGGHDLQLISGAGTTTVTGPATGLGNLTLQQNSPTATGTVSFEGDLAAESLITFAQDYSVSLTGASTTVTNAVTFNNTGGVTLGDGASTLNFSGGLTNTVSTTALNGILLTNNQSITLSDLLISGDSEINTAGGALALGSIVGGGHNLQLISAAGATTVTGPATGIGNLTLQQDAPEATGAVSFEGDLIAESLTTFAQDYSVSLTGASTTVTNAVTFNNTGGVTLGDGASTLNFSGGLTNIASTTALSGILLTNNQSITLSDLIITGDSVINTAGGDLTLGSILGGSHDLQLISAAGTTTVTGPATGIGNLTLQQNSPTATGTVSFEGDLAAESLITFAQDYSVSLTGASTTITNAVTFNNTGGVTLGGGASTLNFSGGLTNIASTTALNGILLTNNQSITLSDLLITGDSEINTAGGALELKGSLNSSGDGATSHQYALTINAGDGNVLLDTMGGAAEGILGDLLINTAGDLHIGGTITIGGTLTLLADNLHLLANIKSGGAISITTAHGLTLSGGLDAGDQTIALHVNQEGAAGVGFTQTAGTIIRTSSDADDAITLSVGGSGDVSLSRVEAAAGGVVINAGGQISDGAAPEASVHAKTLTANAATGIDLKTNIDAFHGNVTGPGSLQLVDADALQILSVVLAGGDTSIAADTLVVGTITTSGSVALTARTGAITDGNDDLLNITAEALLLSSAGGINLDTQVGELDLTTSGAGDVHLEQFTRSLVVANLDVADGDVVLDSDAALSLQNLTVPSHSLSVSATDITFENPLQTLGDLTVTATGDVVFESLVDLPGPVEVNALGDVTFRDTVTLGGRFEVSGDAVTLTHSLTTGGAIEISARNELSLGADVDAGSATISLRANQDGVGSQGLVLHSGAIKTLNTDADALVIDVKGSGDVRIDAIETRGGVSIQAGGSLRGWDQATAEIQAATLQMITGRGINVWTTAAAVTAEVTQAGNLQLITSGAVTAERLVTHAGSIEVLSGDTLRVGEVTAGSGGQVTLTAQSGSILALPGGPGTSLVRGDLLTLAAAADITLWTEANTLNAAISGSGSLTVHNQGALVVAGVSVHDGDALLTASSIVISAAALGSATTDGLSGPGDADDLTFHTFGASEFSAANLTLQAVEGSIVIDANNLADGVDLVVEAATEIIVNGPLQASGSNITLTAAQIELNGALSTSGSGAILLQGAVLLITDSSLAVEDGDLTVTGTIDGLYALTLAANSGEITLQAAIGSTEALTSLMVQSTGTVSFAEEVTTTGIQQITAETVLAAARHQTDNAQLTISGVLALQTNTVLSTDGGDLTLGSIVGGGHDLQLISGAGTTTVTGPATGIGNLTLQEDAPEATGAVSFEGDLAAESLITFAQDYSVSLTGASTTITNAVTFNNTGGAILGGGASTLHFSGGLTNTASTTALNGILLTNNQSITLSDLIITGDSAINTAGGDLTLGSIVGTGHDLQLISAAGTTTVTGPATGIGNLILQQDAPTATGAVSFESDLSAESLITFAQNYSVSLTGASTNVTNAVTFNNTGGAILGDGNSELNFSGGLTNLVSTTILGGTLTANNQNITLSDLLVAGDSTIATGGGDLEITGSLNSSGDGVASHQHDLSINTGGGNAALLTTIGGAADGALGNLQVTAQTLQLANIGTAAAAGIREQAVFTAADGITLTGSVIHTTGGLRFAGPLTVDAAGNLLITTTGGGANDRIVFTGNVGHAAGWDADFTARTLGTSEITFDAAIDLAGNLMIDAAGDLSVGGMITTGGTLTLLGNNIQLLADVQSAGAVSVTAANMLTLGGDLHANNQTILLRANQDELGSEGFYQADSTIIQTTHNASDAIRIIVGGSGDATLATLVASSGGVQVSAGGQIVGGVAAVGPDGEAVNITANDLVVESGADIVLTTNVQTLSATVTGTGDLKIDQLTRLLTVTNLNLTAGNAAINSDAAVVLQNLNLPDHALTLSATDVRFELPVSNLQDLTVTALGTVEFLQSLTASGLVSIESLGDVTFHNEVALGGGLEVRGDTVTLTHDLTTGGAIEILASNELRLDGNVDAGNATIALLANQDHEGNTGFTQTAGTIIRTSSDADDAITLSVGGSGDVSLSRIEAAAGGVVINAGGQISDSGAPGESVDAKSLTATAATGIVLKTDIESFSGTITGSGSLQLVDADSLEIVSVVLADGHASIAADTLTVGAITASGSVALTARTGAITDGNGDLLNITAESLLLSSAGGIDLDTRVGTIDLTVSGPGDVHLEQSSRLLVVANLDVADGDVVLESDAALSLQNLSIPSRSLSISAADITFNNTLQGLSDATVTATGDVVFLAAVEFAGPLEVNALGDVTFHDTVTLGGRFEVSGDAVTLTHSLTTGGAIEISARNELSLGAGVDAGSETISLRANQDGVGFQGLVLHSGAIKTLNTDADALVIDVKGGGDVRIDAIETRGGVSIQAGGSLRGWDQATAEIQAATLQMITGRGINVWTTAAAVTAEVTQAGNLQLITSGAVTADRLVTHAGSIEVLSGDTLRVGEVTAGSGGQVTLTAQSGSILALPGGPGTSLVRGDLLTLAAAADITLWTEANTLNAVISGSGSLTIHNQGALVVAGVSVHDGDAVITGASLVVGSITAPGSVALTTYSGGILGNDETTHLTTSELILMSAGEINLRTNIDFLSATISQQGNLRIADIGQLQVNLINLSSGHIAIEALEELVIAGGVATEQGAIRLVSVNGDLQFVNPVADSILLVYSGGDQARIEGISGSEVIITGPGFVLFRTPQSQYFTVRPELHAVAPNLPILGNVQVDHEGWVTLVVSFGIPVGLEEHYFRLVIDWGDSVQTITAANSGGQLIPLQRIGEGPLPLLYAIRHQYLNNPNSQDPTAPIPISIVASNSLINGGPADVTFFADGDSVDPLVTQVDLVLNVPGTGLSLPAVPVIRGVTEERPAEPEQVVPEPPPSTVIADSSRSVQPLVMASETSAVYERYYVLRIVVQIDEEGNTRELADIRIDDDYLRNLPKLFEMLPDDRYRLYQIREDGVAQLVTDVIIRGGKSAGTVDLDEGLEQLNEHGSNLESAPGQPPDGIPANALDAPQGVPNLQSSLQEAASKEFPVLTKTGIWVGPTVPHTVSSGETTASRGLVTGDLAPLPLAVQVQLARR